VHTRSQRSHSLTPLTRVLEARLGGRPRRHDWFRASAPSKGLYKQFGIAAEAVAAVALEKLNGRNRGAQTMIIFGCTFIGWDEARRRR